MEIIRLLFVALGVAYAFCLIRAVERIAKALERIADAHEKSATH
jgi:hypothetical protein